MSGSTGNIQSEIKRQETEMERSTNRTTSDIARQGHGPLDMGQPERASETHEAEREAKEARQRAGGGDANVREKKALYEQAKAELEREGAAMLKRGAGHEHGVPDGTPLPFYSRE